MKPLPTEPQSPPDIVATGFELGIGVYFKLLMATSLIAFIEFLPSVDMALRLGDVAITPEVQMQNIGRQLLLLLIVLLVLMLVQGMAIARLDHLAKGEPANYREEWRIALQAYLPMIGAFLLCLGIGLVAGVLGGVVGALVGALGALLFGKTGFVVLFCLVLFAVMVYMMVYLMFIQYSIVLEGKGPIEAINQSFRLVYGRWWRPFTVLLIILVMIVVAAIVIGIGFAPFISGMGAETGRTLFIKSAAQMVVGALVAPVMLAIIYSTYRDLKLRAPEA